MSTKKNIILNGIANVGQKTVRVADQLLLVPFFLSAWGAEYYGEWLTLTTIPSILAFSDLGFGTSSCNAFVLAYSGKDVRKAADVLKTGLTIISCSVILGIVLSAVIMLVALKTGLLNKSLIEPSDAIWSLVILMASKLIGFYTQMFDAMYRSKHKAATSVNLTTIEGFIRIAIGVIVLTSGYGIVAFSLSNFFVVLAFNIVYIMYAIHILGSLPQGNFDKTLAKSICGRGLGFMASPIWQSIYFQGSTFVVRLVLGAESVAVFNTIRTVCRSVNQMYSIINASIFPELQLAFGEGNLNKVRKIFTGSIKISFVLAVFGIIMLCTIGQPLYTWWTKNQLTVSDGPWYIFISGIAFNAVWWTAGTVFRAINQPYRFAFFGIISSVLSVLVIYVLSNIIDLEGAAIGYVLLDVLMAVLVLPYAFKSLGISLKLLYKKNGKYKIGVLYTKESEN